MDAVAPATISLYAASYGTFLANTFLQLPGVAVDVAVFDGPVTANRWPMENNAQMQSMVAADAFRMCVQESAVCRAHLGYSAHIPPMTKDAIVDGSLRCIEKLPWLAAENGNYLTSFYSNFMNPNGYKALMGPFWHRLYRCSDSDVEQLLFFNDARQAEMATWQPADPAEYSLGFATNVGTSDIYSEAGANAKTYDQVVEQNARNIVVEGGDLVTSFARSVSLWPSVDTNAITQSFASPTAPVHILVGTLDANTPVGQAQWMCDSMGPGVNCTVYVVPYAHHGLVDASNLCATTFVTELLALDADADPACLGACMPPPDWDGSDDATQSNALRWFGTTDLWNNGMVFDPTPTVIVDSTLGSSSNKECSNKETDVDESTMWTRLRGKLIFLVILIIIYLLLDWFIPLPKSTNNGANPASLPDNVQ